MIKKRAKSKTTTQETAAKRSSRKGKKEMNPAEVRKNIAQMVGSEATTMARAVIDVGKQGQLATVKYLFEMAQIYPEATDGSYTTVDEDCLAKTLLRRLDIPDDPIARDEEDESKAASCAGKTAATPAGENEGTGSGSGAASWGAGQGAGARVIAGGVHPALESRLVPLLAMRAKNGVAGYLLV